LEKKLKKLTNKKFDNEHELNKFITWTKHDACWAWNGIGIQESQFVFVKLKDALEEN
jgi:hypothetical protein